MQLKELIRRTVRDKRGYTEREIITQMLREEDSPPSIFFSRGFEHKTEYKDDIFYLFTKWKNRGTIVEGGSRLDCSVNIKTKEILSYHPDSYTVETVIEALDLPYHVWKYYGIHVIHAKEYHERKENERKRREETFAKLRDLGGQMIEDLVSIRAVKFGDIPKRVLKRDRERYPRAWIREILRLDRKNAVLYIPDKCELKVQERKSKGNGIVAKLTLIGFNNLRKKLEIFDVCLLGRDSSGLWLHHLPRTYFRAGIDSCERWLIRMEKGDILIKES